MDAADDSFLLNLAGEEEAQQPAQKESRKKKSLWERRLEHRQRASVSTRPLVPKRSLPSMCMPAAPGHLDWLQGGRQQGKPATRDVRPPPQKQPAAPSALKGYSLEAAPAHAEPESDSRPAKTPAAQQDAHQGQPARPAASRHAAKGRHAPTAPEQGPAQKLQQLHGNGVNGEPSWG